MDSFELFFIIFASPSPLPFYSYGFGSAGNEKFKIPPDAELQYEVKLKSFEKVRAGDEIPKRSKARGRSGSLNDDNGILEW